MRIYLIPDMIDRYYKRIVPVVVDGGEEDFLWIWGRPWVGAAAGRGGGTHFNGDNPLKRADKCP